MERVYLSICRKMCCDCDNNVASSPQQKGTSRLSRILKLDEVEMNCVLSPKVAEFKIFLPDDFYSERRRLRYILIYARPQTKPCTPCVNVLVYRKSVLPYPYMQTVKQTTCGSDSCAKTKGSSYTKMKMCRFYNARTCTWI